MSFTVIGFVEKVTDNSEHSKNKYKLFYTHDLKSIEYDKMLHIMKPDTGYILPYTQEYVSFKNDLEVTTGREVTATFKYAKYNFPDASGNKVRGYRLILLSLYEGRK